MPKEFLPIEKKKKRTKDCNSKPYEKINFYGTGKHMEKYK